MSAATPVRAEPTTPGSSTADGWSVQSLRDDAAFASLRGEWDELYARARTATPFQSSGWLESWWREYGAPGRLRLVLVRKGGRLVAAAPLMLNRRGPWLVLTPLGTGVSDFTDILVDDGLAAEALPRLGQALLAEPGWHLIDIPEARPGGAAQQLYPVWPGARWQAPGTICLQVASGSFDDLLDRLPNRAAKKMRAKRRIIEAHGISVRRCAADETEDAVRELLRLHRQQWQGRTINEEHQRPRFARHLTRAAGRMAEQGRAVIFQYRMDDRLIASDLAVIGHDLVGAYLKGYDPDLRRLIDVDALLLPPVIGLAEESGRPVLSLLRGDEPYKQRWHPEPVRNQRLLLGRPSRWSAGTAYAALVRARAAAADAARDRLPWLRLARHRARQRAARLAARWR